MGVKVRQRSPRGARKRPASPRPALSEVGFVCVLAVALVVLPVAAGKLATPVALAASALLLLTSVVGMAFALRQGRIPFRPNWLDVAMLSWAATLLLSTFWSVNLHRSLLGLSQTLSYVGAYFLARWLGGREEARRILLGGVATGAFVSAATGLQSYLGNVVLLHNLQWRVFGPFQSPNIFAGYLLVATPAFVFFGLCAQGKILRACSWFALALSIGTLFLTGSKGGILAWVLASAFFGGRLVVLNRPSLRRARVLVPFMVGAVAILVVMMFAVPPVRERLISAGTESHSAVFRLYTWAGSLKMALARPLFGWGVGTFHSVFGRFAIASHTRAAHNDYLQLGAETGFLGLLAYLLVLGGALVGGWKAARAAGTQAVLALVCWAALLGFCLHTLVDSDFATMAIGATLWLFMGLANTASTPAVPAERSPMRPVAKAALGTSLGTCLLLCCYSSLSAYAESQRQAGSRELDRGAFSSAIAHLRQATRFAPLNSEAHRSLARALETRSVLLARGDDLENAREEASRTVALDRMDAVNWVVIGQIEALLGEKEAAEASLQQVTRVGPNYPNGWLILAEFYLLQAELAPSPEVKKQVQQKAFQALAQLERIEESPVEKVKAIPDLVDLTFSKARLYFARTALEQGKPQEALAGANWALNEISRYRTSKSVEALRARGEEPYFGVERLEAMALLLRAEVKRESGDAEGADKDKQAALVAWPEAMADFQSFMKGGILP